MKLLTPVNFPVSSVRIGYDDRIMILGSCFADGVGKKMLNAGFDVCVNPFGTLYNPRSILNAVLRLSSENAFSKSDCVEMGAGAGLFCSFSHHTSFARKTADEFLANANECLKSASQFWNKADKVIVSLGTIYCYFHKEYSMTVSNCLKRNSSEFTRTALSLAETCDILKELVGSFPEKQFIFTVSPIRHLSDGAHANQLSKSTLLLACNEIADERIVYFPAYEILLDELRDYRFYAEDMLHPSEQATEYIWERFIDFAVDEKESVLKNERAFRMSQHRPLH